MVMLRDLEFLKMILAFILCLFMCYKQTLCYPGKPDLENLPELRDEERFPNGSVVGKYSYTDDGGNPVHVKYFADEASYGVELKSIKLLDPESQSLISTTTDSPVKPTVTEFRFPPNILNTQYSPKAFNQKVSYPYYFLNRDFGKTGHKYLKIIKTNPDYEILYKNDLTSPRSKSAYGKVRLYLDKEKRKSRSADTFCGKY